MIKQLASKTVYENPWMTVSEDQVAFSDGHAGMYGVVHKEDFALIIPFDGTHFYLVKQYRYPIKQESIEFPQGKHEGGPETKPDELAAAELREETGLSAGKLSLVGFLHEAAGYSDQGFHIYLATELTEGTQQLDATEVGLTTLKYTEQEMKSAILDGSITDAPTVAAFGLWLLS